MDDMIDLMPGDAMLRQRLEAYADVVLSPDLTTSSRLRARVLAVAHRQADLARADAALTLLPGSGRLGADDLRRERPSTHSAPRHGATWRRTAAVVLAASLGLGAVVGTAAAAEAGGPLYGARLWAESVTLPMEPKARALAEIERLDARINEATRASGRGDGAAVSAALGAYEAIVGQASASAIAADDGVAAAVVEAGLARNVEVLERLATTAPDVARSAIERAVDRALSRSDQAVDAIGTAKPGNGGTNGGGPADRPDKPTREPKPDATPRPTKAPTPEPTPKATKPPKPDPTPRPTPPNGNGNNGNGESGTNGNENSGNGNDGQDTSNGQGQPGGPNPTPTD